jgi:large subunit ribosomal protein L6
MSRIGKLPIKLPTNTTLTIEGQLARANGPKGELSYEFNPVISIKIEDGNVLVGINKETKDSGALWGLTRTLVSNILTGVSTGFEKKLEFTGVGYRAAMEGGVLVMHLGFSHPIRYTARDGVSISVEKTTITVSGIDKQLVGQTAAEIRAFKKPEPYKGKGIRYENEHIRRKAGKTAAK